MLRKKSEKGSVRLARANTVEEIESKSVLSVPIPEKLNTRDEHEQFHLQDNLP